jgi:Domain of unknown function (DUF4351)
MELTTSWKEEGRIEGKLEGRAEMALEMLTYRFGDLDESLQATVRSLAEQKIGDLAKAIFEFKSIDDLTKWLEQPKNLAKKNK